MSSQRLQKGGANSERGKVARAGTSSSSSSPFGIFAMNSITSSPSVSKEEELSGIPTVLKYGILGLICLLAFSIRLFAVVSWLYVPVVLLIQHLIFYICQAE